MQIQYTYAHKLWVKLHSTDIHSLFFIASYLCLVPTIINNNVDFPTLSLWCHRVGKTEVAS